MRRPSGGGGGDGVPVVDVEEAPADAPDCDAPACDVPICDVPEDVDVIAGMDGSVGGTGDAGGIGAGRTPLTAFAAFAGGCVNPFAPCPPALFKPLPRPPPPRPRPC